MTLKKIQISITEILKFLYYFFNFLNNEKKTKI